MRSCKRLKNIDSVSGKLGERHIDVSNMFATSRLTHVPVMETSETGEQRLRGLLSAAKVKRLLLRPESVRRNGTITGATLPTALTQS